MKSLATKFMALKLFIIPLLAGTKAQGAGTCYFPTGNIANGYTACASTVPVSNCCPNGYTCFSNALCIITDAHGATSNAPVGTTLRAACTNPSWNFAICGSFCLSDANQSGKMDRCGSPNQYCCGADQDSGGCNCSNGNGTITVDPGVVQGVIGVFISASTSIPAFTTSTISANSTPSSQTSTLTSASTTGASALPFQQPKKKVTESIGFKVGISFGILLLVLPLIGWGLYRLHDRIKYHRTEMVAKKRQSINTNSTYVGSGNGNGYTGQFVMNNISPSRIQSPAPYNPNNDYEAAAPRGPSRSTTPANTLQSFESAQDTNPSTISGLTARPQSLDNPVYGHVPIPERPGSGERY
ncbi:hypothetical protein BT63DRAFT_439213 [Microthyrium microscopicum]|uniref:Mid2 domain-containing protein n=1 Tax=Microthyrium microscopicum TaxID=703497 RepID=A0A6A6UEN1_9PEZI|nr:hypothetical protein BT63DRAFT_439213 [Microthyrium microscopicum]